MTEQKSPTRLWRQLAAATALAASLLATPAMAQKQWSLGTSSTGSGPYVEGVIIANAVNGSQSKVRVSAQTTGGFNENLALVAANRLDVGMDSVIDIENAYNGTGKFADLKGKEVFRNLRPIFNFERSVCHFLTRADSGIKSFADIKGKRVNLNTPATFTRGFDEQILAALGIKLDQIKVFSISTGKHFDALRDNVIDVGMHCYSLKFNGLLELAASVPVNLLSLPDDAYQRLNEHYHGLVARANVPANTYNGQTEPVKTVGNLSALFVNKEADADQVYAFTKAFWENIDAMAKQEGSFAGFTVELGMYPGKAPLHPGAARFFKEKGVLK